MVNIMYWATPAAEASRAVTVNAVDVDSAITTALRGFPSEVNALAVNIIDADGYEVWDISSDHENGPR